MKMNVYIAAKFQDIHFARSIAKYLRIQGIYVCSSWLEQEADEDRSYEHTSTQIQALAVRDIVDIDNCDVVLWLSPITRVFTNPDVHAKPSSGGSHVEYGYAMGIHKKILRVGPKTNVFHYLPFDFRKYRYVDDDTDLFTKLGDDGMTHLDQFQWHKLLTEIVNELKKFEGT